MTSDLYFSPYLAGRFLIGRRLRQCMAGYSPAWPLRLSAVRRRLVGSR